MTAMRLSDEYLALIRRFPLVPIRDRRHFQGAIAVMKELSTPARLASLTGTESDYLDVLADLIKKYEAAHWQPLDSPMSPCEALAYLMEQSGTTQSELARLIGVRQSHLSEVLSGRRDLSKETVVKLARFFKVSPGLFLPR